MAPDNDNNDAVALDYPAKPAEQSSQIEPHAAQGIDNEQPQQHQHLASSDASVGVRQTNQDVPAPQDPALCGVCHTNPPKYKCSRCYLPYCSVPCNKTHRENHPPDPEPAPESQQRVNVAPEAVRPQVFDPKNPFRALETSDKLQLLFKKYPDLPDQLLEIHAATLPPAPGPEKAIPASLLQGMAKKDNWNHDMGIKNGKDALRKARRAGGEAGKAIREYSELVLYVMNEAGNQEDAEAILRQQMAQEDNKLIESLIAQESRRQ